MTPRRNTILTLGQAAERLGIQPGTLRNQAIRGKLRAIKPGHDWLVDEAEIERYRAENKGRRQPAPLDAILPPEPEPPTIRFGSPRPAPKPGKR